MKETTILTGVKPTGQPHIGNLLGAIRPALQSAMKPNTKSLLFIADYHALTTHPDPTTLRKETYEVAASWLALGLDPNRSFIYRQSDIPEHFELMWILSCFTEKGLLNRAHAYKAIVQENEEKGRDRDDGINMGIYAYPVLMSSDILLYEADLVPVGSDQVQHIEIARDIAQKINHVVGKTVLKLPAPLVEKEVAVVPGLDGRKMSKSYDNTIPLFVETKSLRKFVMKIKTDSSSPTDPKDPATSDLFKLYQHFATREETETLSKRYQSGIGWGEAKEALYQVLDRTLKEPREKFDAYMNDIKGLDKILEAGAAKARPLAKAVLSRVRDALGY